MQGWAVSGLRETGMGLGTGGRWVPSETQWAAFAEGTHKNLLTQWKAFLVFCDQYQYQAMPVSTDMTCLYAQYPANKLKSPQTVRNYVNGVRVLQVLVDQPIEAFRSPDLRLTFRGLARLRQHQPKRAQAITPEMLCRMHKFLDSFKRFRPGRLGSHTCCLFLHAA